MYSVNSNYVEIAGNAAVPGTNMVFVW